MDKMRGYILVLLVALWATAPALASFFPEQLPSCCRNMREMCCMSTDSPVASSCCPMHLHESASVLAAVQIGIDHAEQWMPLAFAMPGLIQQVPSVVFARPEIASSPPLPASRSFSILRI